ncbi:MAG: glycine/sarcosine/betaine reductase selenoprotein B family protein [Rhodospirillales bacterium]|jgi:D-proline reductase (dithiol) PrdB
MARLKDIPEGERDMLQRLPLPQFDSTPFVKGPVLAKRRVSIVSTAALQKRNDKLFYKGEASYRVIPGDTDPNDIIMAHTSVNFDRSGFQQDLNICFPLQRLHELVDEGLIGSVADYHYTVMGGVEPERNEDTARQIAAMMKREGVDTVLLVPI